MYGGIRGAAVGGIIGAGAGVILGLGGVGLATVAKSLSIFWLTKTAIFGLATAAGLGGIVGGVQEIRNAEDPYEQLAGLTTLLFSVLATGFAGRATYKSLPDSWIPWRTRTFYRGTTFLDALENSQNNEINLSRLAANQANAQNDLGPGIYLTESRVTALKFADQHSSSLGAGNTRGGGPGLMVIEISNDRWSLLKSFYGALDRVPISNMEGEFQSWVPETSDKELVQSYAVIKLGDATYNSSF